MTRRLFHLTADAPSHWGAIEASGEILCLAELLKIGHEYDDVEIAPLMHPEDASIDKLIFLTQNPWGSQGWAVDQPKDEIWIEVDPEKVEAHRWSAYGPQHFPAEYLRQLNRPDFGNHRDWFTVESEITRDAWIQVTRRGHEVLWQRKEIA